MMIAVLLFLITSSIILTGVASPVIREVKLAQDLFRSKQSLYSAESSAEDVVFRLKNAMTVGSAESLAHLGYTTNTTISDIAGGKTILSEGDMLGYIRKVTTSVTTGVGVAFNYGVQTGNGGFILGPNAQVNGNVYSNGDIVGSGGNRITGSAIAANSSALAADQTNNTPLPPTTNITFGNANSSQDFAQSFQVAASSPLNKVRMYLRKVSTPGNATVRIVSDNGSGSPSSSTIASGSLSAALVTSSYGWVEVAFSSNPTLAPGTTYWLVIDGATNSSRYYQIGGNTGYVNGSAKLGQQGGSWSANSNDGYFELYLGGVTATISGVNVGSSSADIVHAHTVNNTTASGSLYCQSGSSNNKACNTSLADPVPQAFPVSEGNIAEFKSDAEAGGETTGSITLSAGSSTLGPRKITGNVTLSNNYILTLSGTLWIEGNLSLSNNVQVRLNSGYGSNSGVIVVDGYVDIGNNVSFTGSGTTGSYIMVLSTSDCPLSTSCGGYDAINVANNAGTVLLNAQNGTLSFSNNSGAKAATAKTISMDNNSVITYESGIISPSFSSGPSGGWEINSWAETE